MKLLKRVWSLLTGGFSICKFRMTPNRIRFWRKRTPGSKPDIDIKY